MTVFDSDCGGEFINHDVAGWLQARDIAQTRSRPYQKNDQAHVESKNNHVVRKHAFYWRYDTGEELELLNRLWPLVSLRCNFFTPTKSPSATPAPSTVAASASMTSRPPHGSACRHRASLMHSNSTVAARNRRLQPGRSDPPDQRDPNAAARPGQDQDRGPGHRPPHRPAIIATVNQPIGQGEVMQAPTRSLCVRHQPRFALTST